MTRPLAFLSPASLDTLLSLALRIAARVSDLEEYLSRKGKP